MAPSSHPQHPAEKPPLRTLFLTFLLQGSTSFGGPAAGFASLEAEIVRRRGWVNDARFRELLTWAKLMPGPVASQLAILLGRSIHGTLGGIFAGVAFISPALILVLLLSAMGHELQNQPMAAPILGGLTASALAVVAVACVDLARTQLRTRSEFLRLGIAAVLSFIWPRIEPVLILASGGIGAWRASEAIAPEAPARTPNRISGVALAAAALWIGLMIASYGVPRGFLPAWVPMALVSFRAASITFGTGMAVLPVLHAEFVDLGRWTNSDDFTQALALGQVTPGPIVITATALGYMHDAWIGAAACTLGIFLPSFLNTLVFIPEIDRRVRNRARMEAFVRGSLPWILGSIIAAGLKLAGPLLFEGDVRKVVVFLLTLPLAAIPFRGRRLPPWFLIPLGGALGAAAVFIHA